MPAVTRIAFAGRRTRHAGRDNCRREQMRVWVLNDLAAILFGTGRVATESDGPALWVRLTRDGP
ncbi:hypothetical protein NBRGN_002_00030 [Nocardia brasiliensis NBRC 14402]|nr:hypothetical protein NBRGN_002_00030 [Nocardia brasiliensis NBRC 14402]